MAAILAIFPGRKANMAEWQVFLKGLYYVLFSKRAIGGIGNYPLNCHSAIPYASCVTTPAEQVAQQAYATSCHRSG